MIQKTTMTFARKNLDKLLNDVQYKHNSVVITKRGQLAAAIINIALFEKINHIQEQFEGLSNELAKAYGSVDIATAQVEINEACDLVKKT